MAFNSSSISADERTREHATLFAFGVPLLTTTGLAVAEDLLMGLAATAIGVLAGLAFTRGLSAAPCPTPSRTSAWSSR